MRFKKGFSNLKLEGQGWGIIMGVTRLLLLGQFYTIQTKRDQTFWRGVYLGPWGMLTKKIAPFLGWKGSQEWIHIPRWILAQNWPICIFLQDVRRLSWIIPTMSTLTFPFNCFNFGKTAHLLAWPLKLVWACGWTELFLWFASNFCWPAAHTQYIY